MLPTSRVVLTAGLTFFSAVVEERLFLSTILSYPSRKLSFLIEGRSLSSLCSSSEKSFSSDHIFSPVLLEGGIQSISP